MNDTKSMGLRLPVQASVDRTPAYGALGDGTGVQAQFDWTSLIPIATTLLSAL
jgi:hypothetical protein